MKRVFETADITNATEHPTKILFGIFSHRLSWKWWQWICH